jgi:NAD(P)H dehydrogenase (quinone)
MNIGIIIHSHTGHTHLVSHKQMEKLSSGGHSVKIKRVIPENDMQPDIKKIIFKSAPEISTFDALIFGAPVRAFSLSPVLTAYLNQIPSLDRKKILLFTTMFLPFTWMGGENAIYQMKKICFTKSGDVCETGIIKWSGFGRDKRINKMVDRFCGKF